MKKTLLLLLTLITPLFAEVREFAVIQKTETNIILSEVVLKYTEIDPEQKAMAQAEIAMRRAMGKSAIGVMPPSWNLTLTDKKYFIPKTTRNQYYKTGKTFRIDCVETGIFKYYGLDVTQLQVLRYDTMKSEFKRKTVK